MDDDPDVGAAVQRILAKGPEALGEGAKREDTRENRTDREPHEMQEDADMGEEHAERVEPEAEAAEADQAEEQYLEIPGDTEDAEPVKIPLSEAAEAVKQIRQLNGDIATAVIRAETEAQTKQDEITGKIVNTYQELQRQAMTAAQMMQAFLPQAPDRNLLQTDPQSYYEQKAYYDEFVAYAARIRATVDEALDGEKKALAGANQMMSQRESERLARYIPEWKNDDTRAAKRAEILSVLGPKYGLTEADLNDVVDHRAWRVLADLAGAAKMKTEAPVVRKAVQEKAAKIVNGKMPSREKGTGRFVSEDRKMLRETGSVDAAARLFMRAGLTKGL